MNIGISTASLYPKYLEETIDVIGNSKVKDIEIFLNTESELQDAFISELKSKIDFYGLNIVSVHPFTSAFEPFLLFTDYERRFQDGLNLYARYYNAMNKLGAQYLVLHGDKRGSMSSDELYIDHFTRLSDLASQHDVTLAQENVYLYKSSNVEFMQKLVDNIPDISIVFDNKQALRSNVDPLEFIEKFGKNIKHVHLSDNDSQNDCLPYGWGSVNFTDIFNALKRYGFDGKIMLELYRSNYKDYEDLFKCIDFLKMYHLHEC